MIILPSSVYLVQQPAVKLSISGITIENTNDYPSLKLTTVKIEGYNSAITLWQGGAYDAIGQWTDADVSNRLLAMSASGLAPFSLS